MRAAPECGKPAGGKSAGFLEMSKSRAAIDVCNLKETLADRQAFRIIARFPVTPPVARAAAELWWRAA